MEDGGSYGENSRVFSATDSRGKSPCLSELCPQHRNIHRIFPAHSRVVVKIRRHASGESSWKV